MASPLHFRGRERHGAARGTKGQTMELMLITATAVAATGAAVALAGATLKRITYAMAASKRRHRR